MPERSHEINGEALLIAAEAMKFDYLVALLPLFQVFPDVQRVILNRLNLVTTGFCRTGKTN